VTPAPFGCERARHGALTVNGLRLHYLEWGERGRPPICFLHGGSAHAHWFDAVAPAVAAGRHVVALDQRGHGESDWAEPAAYATADFVADLIAGFDALGWDQPILVGHSMGGHNAMACAAWHPDRVRGLVVVDARPAIPPDRLERLRGRGHRALRPHPSEEAAVAAFRLLPRETVADPALLAHLARAGLARRNGGWVYRFDPQSNGARAPVDVMPVLDRVTAPTLIVRAELSPVLPAALAAQMQAAISGATLAEIPGAYHHLTLDAPEAFTRVLQAFLARLG
jgi:esterase